MASRETHARALDNAIAMAAEAQRLATEGHVERASQIAAVATAWATIANAPLRPGSR